MRGGQGVPVGYGPVSIFKFGIIIILATGVKWEF